METFFLDFRQRNKEWDFFFVWWEAGKREWCPIHSPGPLHANMKPANNGKWIKPTRPMCTGDMGRLTFHSLHSRSSSIFIHTGHSLRWLLILWNNITTSRPLQDNEPFPIFPRCTLMSKRMGPSKTQMIDGRGSDTSNLMTIEQPPVDRNEVVINHIVTSCSLSMSLIKVPLPTPSVDRYAQLKAVAWSVYQKTVELVKGKKVDDFSSFHKVPTVNWMNEPMFLWSVSSIYSSGSENGLPRVHDTEIMAH